MSFLDPKPPTRAQLDLVYVTPSAASAARASAPGSAERAAIRSRVRYPVLTSARIIFPTEDKRVSAIVANASATQTLNIAYGAYGDDSTVPGTFIDVLPGQEFVVYGARPVWVKYPTTQELCIVEKVMSA